MSNTDRGYYTATLRLLAAVKARGSGDFVAEADWHRQFVGELVSHAQLLALERLYQVFASVGTTRRSMACGSWEAASGHSYRAALNHAVVGGGVPQEA